MEVIRARTAGFCMGVSLALQKLDSALVQHKGAGHIYTYGPLIHNPQVLAEYGERGVRLADGTTPLGSEDCVVIRAHGIPRHLEEELKASGVCLVDATCPKVKKAQLAIARATEQGACLLLFGEADHPEVRGLVSYARGPAIVLGQNDDFKGHSFTREHGLVLASQTTQDREAFQKLRAQIEELYPEVTVLSTICDATRERQEEARSIAMQVDIMVVVGGRSSGNTRRLADVAASCGIETVLVETAAELEAAKFMRKKSVGLTAGASTPKSVIDQTEAKLTAL